MSSDWLLNIELPVQQVGGLCRDIAGATVSLAPDGFTIARSRGSARAYDAHPDPGTDIVIRDWSESLQWTLWEHFAASTDAPMQLWQHHGLTVAIRVRMDEGGQPHLLCWNTREVAATVAREALSHPVDAPRILDLVSTTFPGAASDVGFRAQELAAEMVRHEILVVGIGQCGPVQSVAGHVRRDEQPRLSHVARLGRPNRSSAWPHRVRSGSEGEKRL